MGLVVARPQSPGELLDLAVSIAKRHLPELLSLGALPLAAAIGVDLVLRLAGAGPAADYLGLLPVLVCLAIAEGRMIGGAWQLLHEEPIDPVEIRAQVRRQWLAVVLGYSLKWLFAVVGFILLLAPGVFVLLWYFAVPTVTVIEGRGVWSSMHRSRALARGQKKRLLATVGLFDITWAAVGIGFAAILSDAQGELPTWATITNWALTVLLAPVHATLMAAVYTDIRIRQEGYDIQVAVTHLPGAA